MEVLRKAIARAIGNTEMSNGDDAAPGVLRDWIPDGTPGVTDENNLLAAADSVLAVLSSEAGTSSAERVTALQDALADMLAGWQYIRKHHGDLYGVGWDRAEQKVLAALSPTPGSPEPAPSSAEREADLRVAFDFLEGLGENAAPGKREALNPIIIGGGAKLAADVFRAALRPTPTGSGEPDSRARVERVRHLKRGTEYEVLGEAEAQVSVGDQTVYIPCANVPARLLHDHSKITVYRSAEFGTLYCRFTDEFRDGRFETIPALQSAPIASAAAGADLPQEIRDLHEARLKARTAYHEADGTWSQLSLAAHRFDAACKEWVEQLLATPTPDPHPVPAMEGR